MSQDNWFSRVTICKDILTRIDVLLNIAHADLDADGTINNNIHQELTQLIQELGYVSKKRNIKGKK